MKHIIVIAVLSVAIFTLSGVFIVRSFNRTVTQPIAFNHAKHVENGVECFGCHESVRESAVAGKPKLETCMLCHETPLGPTAAEETVRQYAARKEEIPWRRLFKMQDSVFFPHQAHVVGAEIECKTCHGTIGESVAPPTKPLIEFTMDNCIACHRSRGASIDCLACHR